MNAASNITDINKNKVMLGLFSIIKFLERKYVLFVILGMMCLIIFFERFMWAEDAVVLFNRFNSFESPSPLFYYAGYISFYPQIWAFLVSPLSPEIQTILYSLFAAGVSFISYYYLYRILGSAWPCILIASYFFVADANNFVNLSYSFWSGLLAIGLIIAFNTMECSKISFCEFGLLIVLSTGSPLSIGFIPLAICHVIFTHDKKSVMYIFFLVIVFFALKDYGAQNTEFISLEHIVLLFGKMLSRALQGDLEILFDLIRLAGFLLSVLALMLVKMPKEKYWALVTLYLCSTAVLAAFILTRFEGEIGGRYIFLQVAFTFVVLWEICRRKDWSRRLVGVLAMVSLILIAPARALVSYQENVIQGIESYRQVASWDGTDRAIIFTRSDNPADVKWALVLTPEPVAMSKCGNLPKSPYRAYCHDGVYYYFHTGT